MWEEHLHLSYGLLAGHLVLGVFIKFLYKLSTVLNHLFHSALLFETPVFIAVLSVFIVSASVGIGAVVVNVIERHSAALTKSLFCFHNQSLLPLFLYK